MGGPVGNCAASRLGAHTVQYNRLYDYRMEHIMLGGAEKPATVSAATGLPRWRQQVQYAIGHTLNDFYSLLPEVRRETPIQFLLERRWPPKGDAFPSLLQYWEIKTGIADELMRIVSSNHLQDHPVMLYEQWHIPVPDLSIELSMIFQLAWKSAIEGRSLNIQKFMVSGNEEVITGFMHMANVFCHRAYGEPPESVEIYSLLDGGKFTFDGSSFPLAESMDYVQLLSVFLEQGEMTDRALKYGDRRHEKGEDSYGGYGLM
ncbi:hypothetical protein [Paenibacillus monticola]|uniref:Uncharacterized protein n=1 Tax=Paenibacillus monticola TaxID=2666075 RepID=A0A7X2L2E2_9BACL|nr:hypothetical protein [Paenibacillus monticola]MRN53286.1 hypothetical protein [Paenibacillus monticola]